RYLVGLAQLQLPGVSAQQLFEQAEPMLRRGDFGQRLRLAVLAGELVGPEEALRHLRALEEDAAEEELDVPARGAELLSLLNKLYSRYEKGELDPDVLTEAQQAEVRRRLGWFGELALAPEDGPDLAARKRALAPARRAAVVHLVGFASVGLGVM